MFNFFNFIWYNLLCYGGELMTLATKQALLIRIKKMLVFLEEYYPLVIGTIILILTMQVYNSNITSEYKFIISLIWFGFLTAYKDMRKDVKWTPFIILCIPLFIFLLFLLFYGQPVWQSVVEFEQKLGVILNLNGIFKSIPFNDAAFARIYRSENLTWYLRLVYNIGFVACPLMCFCRSVIAKDLKKALKYLCSAHIFQVFLISPFYITCRLQEVWYVLGDPDGVGRVFRSEAEKQSTVLNCFPSMHTSIAFAAFLLLLREKDKVFKFIWGFFCLSVIYSTMYLEVHWVLDVIGGLILGYFAVKLTDFVFEKLETKIRPWLNKYYYRNKNHSIPIDNHISAEK